MRLDRGLHGVVVARDGRVGGFEVLVIFALYNVGEAPRLEVDIVDAALVLIRRYLCDDGIARRGIGLVLSRRGSCVVALFVVCLPLIRLHAVHRVEADVYVVDVLYIDVAQLFDVHDVLDDLVGYDGVGVELRLELHLRRVLVIRGDELQLAALEVVLCRLLALCLRLCLQRLYASVFYLIIFGGVYLLHIAVVG